MRTVTVTQVTEYISNKLDNDIRLKNLAVEGEITGLSLSNGNYYFSLTDSVSTISCAIWRSNVSMVDMDLIANGKKIVALCGINTYSVKGLYRLSIRKVKASGDGEKMNEFNRIRKLLENEGLFDKKHKKPIPLFPERVGVITSSTGAAIEDIRKIITAKNDYTDILIFPTAVQGIGAVESICSNIRLANELAARGVRIDTLIVGRGGGSAEDLAAFNDETVCRTIFASDIPIISAVGHESDFSISDMVADVRAETPTAAADMAVMNTFELREDIENYRADLLTSAKRKIEAEKMLLASRRDLLLANVRSKISSATSEVDKALILLKENNPDAVFTKGYAAVLDESGNIVPAAASVHIGNKYTIRMRDGSFTAVADKIDLKGENDE